MSWRSYGPGQAAGTDGGDRRPRFGVAGCSAHGGHRGRRVQAPTCWRAGETYWCGLWLGGCGQQLTTRLCTSRACHFAHHPHASIASKCRRTASGVASADHLYIKQNLLRWLADQDNPTTAEIERAADGTVAGSVRFTPQDGTGLRVLLSDDHRHQLGDQNIPHVLIAENMAEHLDSPLLRHGYVNLVRCVPDGTRRRPQIGTKTYGGTTWYELTECELTPDGLTTPGVEEVHRQRASRRLLGQRSAAQSAPQTAAPVIGGAVNDPQGYDRATAMRELEEATTAGRSVTRIRLCPDRAEAATRQGATLEENELMRAASDTLLRLERGVGLRPSPAPKRSTPKLRRVQTRTGPVRPLEPRLRSGPVSAGLPAPRRTSPDSTAPRPKKAPPPAERLDALTEQEKAHAARLKIGAAAMPKLPPGDQAELLYQVDRETAKDEPLLSTTLAVSDPTIIPAFRTAAARLGIDLPDHLEDLRDVLEADVETLHALWRHR
ncbi:competence protein CoiA family protein [Streptomyces sp. NPDC051064]|uniref:competence protein CoiA family protein n=1 Tax=Streptomyces sp. NPDC051064 TaxID=3365641 RepID=UPI0037A14998